MRRRKKKGMNPIFAVVLLATGVAVAANAFLGLGSSGAPPVEDAEIVELPEMDSSTSSNEDVAAVEWSDLLARHGSFDGSTEVRAAFSVLEEARAAMPAPGGEVAGQTYWEGPDPPELRLGVLMISAESRRAVLGGRVVGVSDEINGVVVQSIDRDQVRTLWGSKLLTYDLENGWPREFRPELERRKREAKNDEPVTADAGNASSQEIPK